MNELKKLIDYINALSSALEPVIKENIPNLKKNVEYISNMVSNIMYHESIKGIPNITYFSSAKTVIPKQTIGFKVNRQ